MISRTIYKEIEKSIKSRPVTLITGARQVGKTSLAVLFQKKYNFSYVSLDSYKERELAKNDPIMFYPSTLGHSSLMKSNTLLSFLMPLRKW